MFKIPKGTIINKNISYDGCPPEDMLIYDGDKFMEFTSEEGKGIMRSIISDHKKDGVDNV